MDSEESRIRHLLSRATFGARPDDLQAVRKLGPDKWLDQQLAAPSTSSERELDPLLKNFFFTGRTPAQLIEHVQEIAPQVPGRSGPFQADVLYQKVLFHQLLAQRILRSVFSRWQVREVLTDFFFNHFNATMDKEVPSIYGMPSYERDAIRPHVLGRFRVLLGAVAKHPVLIEFLDNKLSDGNKPGGLNENYGREMLELYTVSVGAKYTQKDVVESSRCFSGWGFDMNGESYKDASGRERWKDWVYEFRYDRAKHDVGAKQVLGCRIPAGGQIEDGERLLDYLAKHPETANFLARKLATRLIADQPPQSVVDKAAAVYLQTDGHLGKMVRAILTSPEFYESKYRRAKLKTPLEFLASTLRACPPKDSLIAELRASQDANLMASYQDGGRSSTTSPLIQLLATTNAPYRWKSPAGWIDRASTWATSTGVRDRLDVSALVARMQPKPRTDLAWIQEDLLGQPVSENTQKALKKAAGQAGTRDFGVLTTALMSAEFQHR